MTCLNIPYQLWSNISCNSNTISSGCNQEFGGKIGFSMSDVEWRWYEDKSFFPRKSIRVFRISSNEFISKGGIQEKWQSKESPHIPNIQWTIRLITARCNFDCSILQMHMYSTTYINGSGNVSWGYYVSELQFWKTCCANAYICILQFYIY